MKKTQIAIISPRTVLVSAVIALILVGLIAFVVIAHREQQAKLTELNQEKWRLEERIDELTREQERLQADLEYTKSLEGLLQYARDNLGYIDPDDVRIVDGN